MRRSNMSPNPIRRGVIVSIAVAASLVLAGCSSATTTGSAEPAPTPSATETVSREAGWFNNRVRACVQNKTTRNLEYAFDDDALDDQLKSLSQPAGTMGPNAFVCGGSDGSDIADDTVSFRYTNASGKLVILHLANSKGSIFLRIFIDDKYATNLLTPGQTLKAVFYGQVIEALVEPNLRTFDKLTAYPYDVKIYDAP